MPEYLPDYRPDYITLLIDRIHAIILIHPLITDTQTNTLNW